MQKFDREYFDTIKEANSFVGFDLDWDMMDYEEEVDGDGIVVSFFAPYVVNGEVPDRSIGYLVEFDYDKDWGGANYYVTGPVKRTLTERVEVVRSYQEVLV